MKAWILEETGKIRCREWDDPISGCGEVLVEVHAAGICGSDIPRIFRDGAHCMPLICGHEFSGKVIEANGGYANDWMGKRVGIFPLIPCRECAPCRDGHYELCRQYSYLGSRQDGGFAEYVRVPASNLIELPENVSYEQAAMLEPMAVAVHAMRRVEITQESSVVVYGLGTIGMLLLMFLMERDISNIYAVGNKDFQRQIVLSMGLSKDHFCDTRREDVRQWVASHTNNVGADVVFECVGKMDTITTTVDVAAPLGRICMVGNPQSDIDIPRDIYWKILRNQLTVTGTWNSSFHLGGYGMDLEDERGSSDWEYVIDLLHQGRIHPEKLITHRLSFEELERGLHIMRDKTEDYIKVMIVIRDRI